MTYCYCLGIRTNDIFQERVCENREYCPYYCNVNISDAMSHPDVYIELDTYNNKQCQYFKEEWKKNKIVTCETSDMLMDGIRTVLNKG